MAKHEKFDTPDWLINAAEYSQRLPRFAVRGLTRWLAGADSRAYAQARWETAEQVVDQNGEACELPVADADPDASILAMAIPRLKKRAVVVGASSISMDEILFNHQAMPAAAYTYKDKTHAGTVIALGHEYHSDDSEVMDTAALRAGRSEFGVGIGAWLPSERTIIVPKDLHIIQWVDVEGLADLFPSTPLV